MEANDRLQIGHRSGGSVVYGKSVREGGRPAAAGTHRRGAAGFRELARPFCSEKAALAVAPGSAQGPGG